MGDLNERVDARLAQLESMAGSLRRDLRDPQHQLMCFVPEYGLSMVASWRERWYRHRSYAIDLGAVEDDKICLYCTRGYEETDWPCPDALSVLREIRIEP